MILTVLVVSIMLLLMLMILLNRGGGRITPDAIDCSSGTVAPAVHMIDGGVGDGGARGLGE